MTFKGNTNPDRENMCLAHCYFGEEWHTLSNKVKNYICDLETKCDPSGDIQTIGCLAEQRDALVNVNLELKLKIKELVKKFETTLEWIEHMGDFRNGVECFGVDEGLVEFDQFLSATKYFIDKYKE